MKLNVELLERVAKTIVENPDRFAMETWIGPCGTTACIGGWAISLEMGEGRSLAEVKKAVSDFSIMHQAARVIFGPEAGTYTGVHLFGLSSWPENFKNAYIEAPTSGIRAKVAADYIHYFIEQHKKNELQSAEVQGH